MLLPSKKKIPLEVVAPIFLPLMQDDNFYIISYGSRNSTKSHMACAKMLLKCMSTPKFKCLMVRGVQRQVRHSIYDTLKEVAEMMGVDQFFKFNKSTCVIECTLNGNVFLPLGTLETLGNTGRAKSIPNPTHAICDEADEQTEDVFNKLVDSLRGGDKMQMIIIFNTHVVDPDHWIFKRWFPDLETFELKNGKHAYIKSKRRQTTILHTTYLDNPFLQKQNKMEFEEMKKLEPERYEIDGLGLLKKAQIGNLAVPRFDRRVHVKDVEFIVNNTVYITMDFNRWPHHTASMWQYGQEDEEFYNFNLFQEFCLPKHSARAVATEMGNWLIKRGYSRSEIYLFGDHQGTKEADHTKKALLRQVADELRSMGFQVVDKVESNPRVVTSLDFLNGIFNRLVNIRGEAGQGKTLMYNIDRSCKFHIADFESTKVGPDNKLLKTKGRMTYREDGQDITVTYEKRGHGIDAVRYLTVTVFKAEFKAWKSRYKHVA